MRDSLPDSLLPPGLVGLSFFALGGRLSAGQPGRDGRGAVEHSAEVAIAKLANASDQ